MRNILLPLLTSLIICCTFLIISIKIGGDKVSIIDSTRLLNEYNGTKLAIAEFEQKSKVLQSNLDTLTSEFQAELKKFEKERNTMTEKEILLSQEILRNKQAQLEQYNEITRQKLQEEDKQMTTRLLKKVNQIIENLGREHNYKFILGAKGDGGVLYGEEAIDITDKILEILNEEV